MRALGLASLKTLCLSRDPSPCRFRLPDKRMPRRPTLVLAVRPLGLELLQLRPHA